MTDSTNDTVCPMCDVLAPSEADACLECHQRWAPCPICQTLVSDGPDLTEEHTASDGTECEGVCHDCGKPKTYDNERGCWAHVDPQQACFLIQAELKEDNMSQDNEAQWTEHAKQILEGRKVVEVRYMNEEEAASFDWHERPLLIIFDDNTVIFASSDDEGNSGGAIFGQSDAMNDLVIPAMRYVA